MTKGLFNFFFKSEYVSINTRNHKINSNSDEIVNTNKYKNKSTNVFKNVKNV